MRAFLALVSLCAARVQLPDEDETVLLQVSTAVASRHGGSKETDGSIFYAGPSNLRMRLEMNSSTPTDWGREVERIDFVYCWAGESVQQDASKGDLTQGDTKNHMEGFGFNEMEVSLRSLLLFAPWLNKVYVLVNGPAQPPKSVQGDPRVQMVDRCTLFPNKSDCPTKNTAACQAVVHRVPGLKEHFVFMEDDFMLAQPMTPLDLFSPDGRPLMTIPLHSELHSLYDTVPHTTSSSGERQDFESDGPDVPPSRVPLRINTFVHRPVGLLTSFALSLEESYPEWFAFVRSHKTRFTCCNASHYGNGLEEDFITIWPAMLRHLNKGVIVPGGVKPYDGCHCDSEAGLECIRKELARSKFLTIQSCSTSSQWQAAKEFFEEHMDKFDEVAVQITLFGKPYTVSVWVGTLGWKTAMTLMSVLGMIVAFLAVCTYNKDRLENKPADLPQRKPTEKSGSAEKSFETMRADKALERHLPEDPQLKNVRASSVKTRT